MRKLVSLGGIDGATPLGFLAAVGLLHVLDRQDTASEASPTLEWNYRGAWTPAVHCDLTQDEIAQAILRDREHVSIQSILALNYPKLEKDKEAKSGKTVKEFGGLRPPVGILRVWLAERLDSKDLEGLRILSALLTETACEPIKTENIPSVEHTSLPVDHHRADALSFSATQSVFDFTSKNQQFLAQAKCIAEALSTAEIASELFGAAQGIALERTMGWNQGEDRPGAMFTPTELLRLPALEWLAFRALTCFPTVGFGDTTITASCKGRRKQGRFRWCVWEGGLTARSFRSLASSTFSASMSHESRRALGITEVFECELGKGADGYSGVFKPATVV